MSSSDPTPRTLTVIVVSDHADDGRHRVRDVRRALSALADQDVAEPFDVVVCDSEKYRVDLTTGLTGLALEPRMLFLPDEASYAIKNAGVESVRSELVALLDADCLPRPDWLRCMLDAVRADPKIAVVSGRTVYPGHSFMARACALLGRAYVDRGGTGTTRFIAINNCVFRREAYLQSPLPADIGTFSSRIQSEALQRSGWSLRFDPRIEVVHDYEGWTMEADFRRNCGHGTVRTRLEDSSLPYAWLARLGPLGIPAILVGKIVESWRDCARCGRGYGLHGLELPGAMLLSIALHFLEIPGMLQAYARTGLGKSSFR